jgi:hypothetical protein
MTRVRIGPALAALVALLALAGPALAAAPIEGQWRADNGDVYEFYARGADQFGMRVVDGSNPCFPEGETTTRLSGSGVHYSGTVPYYYDSDCSFAGDGAATFDIDASGDQAAWHSDPPSGVSCCSFDRTFTRESGPSSSTLRDVVQDVSDHVDGRVRALHRASGARARRHAFRAVGRTAHRGAGRIAALTAAGDDETTLQDCAVAALGRIERGARAHRPGRIGRGRAALHACLGG